jgi:hypothetical protein
MRTARSLLLCLTILTSQTACSLFSPHQELISATASERDAEIYINGTFVGKGVGSLQVQRDQAAAIMVTKKGFIPQTTSVPVRFSTTGILDILGGCTWLIPFIGATSPGFWQHETTNVSVVLQRQ